MESDIGAIDFEIVNNPQCVAVYSWNQVTTIVIASKTHTHTGIYIQVYIKKYNIHG